jgi:hypothetical protein
MKPIDAAMETLTDIADNHGAIPPEWIDLVKDHELSDWSLLREDLAIIVNILQKLAPCKFLEIGAGMTTPILYSHNPNGLNISLEDSGEWMTKVKSSLPVGNGIVLTYSHAAVESKDKQRTDWKARLKKTVGYNDQDLTVPYYMLQKRALIPDWLWTIQFDVILVDGPFGFGPGRSGTSMLASKLSSPTSVIFIDDAVNRPHEMEKVLNFFPDRYLHSFPDSKLTILV